MVSTDATTAHGCADCLPMRQGCSNSLCSSCQAVRQAADKRDATQQVLQKAAPQLQTCTQQPHRTPASAASCRWAAKPVHLLLCFQPRQEGSCPAELHALLLRKHQRCCCCCRCCTAASSQLFVEQLLPRHATLMRDRCSCSSTRTSYTTPAHLPLICPSRSCSGNTKLTEGSTAAAAAAHPPATQHQLICPCTPACCSCSCTPALLLRCCPLRCCCPPHLLRGHCCLHRPALTSRHPAERSPDQTDHRRPRRRHHRRRRRHLQGTLKKQECKNARGGVRQRLVLTTKVTKLVQLHASVGTAV